MGPVRRMVLPSAALLLLAACASAGGPGGERPAPDEAVIVRVENQIIPRRPITVSITSSAGTRYLLGTVSPGRTRMLEFPRAPYIGAYRLVAETAGGARFLSRPFRLFEGATVEWRLSGAQSRSVTVSGG